MDDQKVAEAAVVSRPDELKGEAIVAFVTLKGGYEGDEAMLEGAPGSCREGDRSDRETGQHHLHY